MTEDEEAVHSRDQWEAGEEISSHGFAPGLVGSGDWLKSTKAVYFEKECEFAGRVDKVIIEGSDIELVITLWGTSNEDLLKFGSGLQPPVIRAHLCQRSCDQKRSNQDLVHLLKFQKFDPEGPKTWEDNLHVVDDNTRLRTQQQEWEREQEKRRKKAEQEVSEDSRSVGEKDKKKKTERKRSRSKKKKKKSQKMGGRTVARKDPKHLYGGTGLDPEAKLRRKLQKKIKKKLKKSRNSSSGTSRSSSSSSTGEMDEEILEDRSKVQKLAELAPGILTAASIQQMKAYVLQASGSTWEADSEIIPPIMSQYVRHYLAPRSSGGLLREMVTLAFVGDLLVQSRPAEALDAVSQRLKSLEMVIGGQPWTSAQKIEIVPPPEPSMSSRAEMQIAQKEARLDSRAKGGATQWEKGKGKTKGKDKDKGKEKGKGGAKGREETKK